MMLNRSRITLSIRTKLLLILGLVLVGTLMLALLALSAQKSMLLEDRKVKTKHVVETAFGVLQHFHALQAKGQMTEQQARQGAITAVKALRYEGSEYFWINDLQPRVVMHPIKPALDGKDVSELKDPTGKALFVEFVKVVKDAGAGYVDYQWPKPGATDPVAKTSYVMLFKPWGWVIGSGIYIDDVQRAYWRQAGRLGAGILVLGAILMAIMGYLLRSILTPLKALEAGINCIQQSNDLTQEIQRQSDDEIGRIARAFNAMMAAFRDAVSHAVESSASLTGASSQLTRSSEGIANASKQQSDSIASMAAAMEELTASIDSIRGSAEQAHSIVRRAGELSGYGGEIVNGTVKEIQRIADAVNTTAEQVSDLGHRTDQISKIVKTIQDIADQTNLLALNAAIEAARAGEEGRGFAVVADEVRSLAERTTNATKEIAGMISAIQGGMAEAVASMNQGKALVRQGVQTATLAGNSIHEIQNEAQRVVQSVSDISRALNEQSAAATLVAQNVEEIARMIEANSGGSRQIADAAQGMEMLARDMHGAVSHFRI